MNIGIDARMYGPNHGGIGRYVQQLINQLLIIDLANTYTFFVHPKNPIPNIPQKHTIIETPIPWYSLKEQTKLPKIMNQSNCDIIHFPHWNIPILLRKPFITTIHDLILIHHPDRRASTLSPLVYKFKHNAFKLTIKLAALRAQHILTVSEFSKQDIIKTLKINPDNITVTHLGFNLPNKPSIQEEQKKPFMLNVGVQYPHKNHQLLLNLFPKLIHPAVASWDLIITGPHGPFTDNLTQNINHINQQCTHKTGRIKLITNTTDAELTNLYEKARILLFPSLYEGFGLPPLEAMTHGTPVIASNQSSIPEICGNAALLLDPRAQAKWIDAIITIATEKRFAESLISRGHLRLHSFSWSKCASSTLEVYKNIHK